MRIEDLFEAINQTSMLTQDAYATMAHEIDNFIKTNSDQILSSAGADDYLNQIDDLDEKMKDIRNRGLEYKEEDRLLEPLHNKIGDLYGEAESAMYHSSPDKGIIDDFIESMEVPLSDLAQDYIEAQFGKIEGMTPSGNGWSTDDFNELTKKNLYWLQHIIVQIDTKGKNSRTGEPKTAGGYFQKWANKDALHNKSSNNVNWQTDIAVHINLYASDKELWKVLTNRLMYNESEDRYGETSISNPVPKFLKSLLSTFVHEVVHLEQDARAKMSKNHYRKDTYSKIPNPEQSRPKLGSVKIKDPRGSDAKNKDRTYRNYKGGRRGNPVQDVDNFEDNVDRWAAYLGTVNEIEAHAANTASEMYMEFLESNPFRYTSSAVSKQREINQFVDNAVDNVRYGDLPKNSYEIMIADTAREAMAKPNPTNREKQFIKVWQLFIKKTIKHLESYKKAIPKDTW